MNDDPIIEFDEAAAFNFSPAPPSADLSPSMMAGPRSTP